MTLTKPSHGQPPTGPSGWEARIAALFDAADTVIASDALKADKSALPLSVKDNGAVGDGTANDRAAVVTTDTAAVAAGGETYFPTGRYKVSSNLTIASPVRFATGATLEPATGITVTLSGIVAAPDFATVFAGAGTVVLGRQQRVCADWWGGKGTAAAPLGTVQKAITNTAQGTRIEVAGKYWSTPIQVLANEDALTGDLCKLLVGVGAPGLRSSTATTQWGAEIYLGNTQNADLLWLNGTVRSNGQPSRISFGIDNVKLNGNKANNATGLSAFRLSQVKDIYIGRLLVESAKTRGMYVSAQCNQAIGEHVEAMSNDSHGIDLAALGDSHFGKLLGGTNGGIGVQLAGGTQVDQIHQYLNTTNGLSITGDKCQLGAVRLNDNGSSGLLMTGATNCTIDSLISVDNGTDTGTTNAQRSGVRFTGASYDNKIGHMNAVTTSATQQYGVRFDTPLTGLRNLVGTYCGSGNVLLDVSLAAGTNRVQMVNGVAWNEPLVAIKTADESVTNNTVQADNELLKAVEANAFYKLKAFIIYDSDAAADFRVRLSLPSGTTANCHDTNGAIASTTTGSGNWTLTDNATLVSAGGAGVGTKLVVEIDGWVTVGATAGNVGIEWAQITTNALATTVYTGSVLELIRIT